MRGRVYMNFQWYLLKCQVKVSVAREVTYYRRVRIIEVPYIEGIFKEFAEVK
jgi:hypothetical protein